MRVYVVIFYYELFKDDSCVIKSICSTKMKAEQFIREFYKLPDDASVDDYSKKMYDLSGTKLEIREYGVV